MSENINESQKILTISHNIAKESKELNNVVDKLRQLTFKVKTKSLEKNIFDLSKTDHLLFINNIKDKVEENIIINESEISEFTNCRFGKWYYGEDSKKFKTNEFFLAIDEPHKNVHNIAKKIAKHTMENRFKEAYETIKELDTEANKVVNYLENLKKTKNL